ncbi:MAG: hypothetical protein WBP81_07345 [Solirubrobacteraceae bacterium]
MNSTAVARYDAMFVTDAVGGRSQIAHRTGIERLAHNGRNSSEVVAGLVRGARVVKPANTLAAAVLGSDPHEAGGNE